MPRGAAVWLERDCTASRTYKGNEKRYKSRRAAMYLTAGGVAQDSITAI